LARGAERGHLCPIRGIPQTWYFYPLCRQPRKGVNRPLPRRRDGGDSVW